MKTLHLTMKEGRLLSATITRVHAEMELEAKVVGYNVPTSFIDRLSKLAVLVEALSNSQCPALERKNAPDGGLSLNLDAFYLEELCFAMDSVFESLSECTFNPLKELDTRLNNLWIDEILDSRVARTPMPEKIFQS